MRAFTDGGSLLDNGGSLDLYLVRRRIPLGRLIGVRSVFSDLCGGRAKRLRSLGFWESVPLWDPTMWPRDASIVTYFEDTPATELRRGLDTLCLSKVTDNQMMSHWCSMELEAVAFLVCLLPTPDCLFVSLD